MVRANNRFSPFHRSVTFRRYFAGEKPSEALISTTGKYFARPISHVVLFALAIVNKTADDETTGFFHVGITICESHSVYVVLRQA